MDMAKVLTYRKGINMTQRRVTITTAGDSTVLVDFLEQDGHSFKSEYYMMTDRMEITTVRFNRVVGAWLEKDTGLFNHPDLTIS
jgi:hypothetical protein